MENSVWASLKSGVVLCQLVNCIKPGTIVRSEAKLLPMIEMENIQLYLTALWGMGVPSLDLFITSDLYRGENIGAVLRSVQALAVVAVGIGWKGPEFPVNPEKPKPGMKKSRSLASMSVSMDQNANDSKLEQLKSQIGRLEEQNCVLQQQLTGERANVAKLQEVINELKRKDRQTIQLSEAAKQKEVEAMRAEIVTLHAQVKELKQAADKHASEAQRDMNKLQLKEFEVGDLKETVEHLRNSLRDIREEDSDCEEDEEEYVVEVKTFSGNSALKPASKPTATVAAPAPPPPKTQERDRSPSARATEPLVIAGEANWKYDPRQKMKTLRQARLAKMKKKKSFATVELKLTDEHDDDEEGDPQDSSKPKLLTSHQRTPSLDIKPTAARPPPSIPQCSIVGCTKYRVVGKQHCADHCASQLNTVASTRPSTTVTFSTTSTVSTAPVKGDNNNNNQDMDGQFYFRAEEEGSLNSTNVLQAQRHLKQLLRNRKLTFKNVELLSELFRTDSGRRVLVYILGSLCKTQSTPLQLTQDNFEILHHLVDNTLHEMDIKLSKDIKSVMLLMRATTLLSWKSHGEERLLRDYLLTHFLDLPFSFWEEYYWRSMTGTCRHTMHKQLKANEQDMGWMKDLFIETGFDMYTFGVPRQTIKEFVQRMSLLTPGFTLVNEVEQAVENYPKRYYDMNGRAQSPSELAAVRESDGGAADGAKAKLRWQVTETRDNLKKFAEAGAK